MDNFSISELQQFSGIKAHTIRMWEQRYNALKPRRSEGNTRYYNSHQLRRLLNIVSLMHTEYKVSELCTMTDKELFELLGKEISAHTRQPYEYFITLIIASALEYDETQFNKVFSTAILRYGLNKTYIFVLYPVLVRLGLMWSTDVLRPAHEHFITELMRKKILSAIDTLAPAKPGAEIWMLFLQENEHHEMGLLFANFLIRQSGRRVIYLGANVPLESLKAAAKETGPACLLTFLVRKSNKEDDEEFISHLTKQFKEQNTYIACDWSRFEGVKRKGIHMLHTVKDLEDVLLVV